MKKILYVIPLLMGLMVVGCGKDNTKTKTKEITFQEGLEILEHASNNAKGKYDLIGLNKLDPTNVFSIDFDVMLSELSTETVDGNLTNLKFEFESNGYFSRNENSLNAKTTNTSYEESEQLGITIYGAGEAKEELFGFTESENKGRYYTSDEDSKLYSKVGDGKPEEIDKRQVKNTLAAVDQVDYNKAVLSLSYEFYSNDLLISMFTTLQDFSKIPEFASRTVTKKITKEGGITGLNISAKIPAEIAFSKLGKKSSGAYIYSEVQMEWDSDYNIKYYLAKNEDYQDEKHNSLYNVEATFTTEYREAKFNKAEYLNAEPAKDGDIVLLLDSALA